MVLAAGLDLDPAGDVDRVGLGDRDRGGDVVGPQPAGEDRRHVGAVAAQQLPVEALAGPAPEALAAAVEEVEVGPVGLGGVDVGGAGDVDRLDHLDPGPPRHLGAERRPLGPVQLHHRQARVLDRLGDLLQSRVDEDADDLALAPERGADLRRVAGLDAARAAVEMDQPDRPGAEPHGLGRVVEIRDPAELDPHAPRRTRSQGPDSASLAATPVDLATADRLLRRSPGRSPSVTVAVLVSPSRRIVSSSSSPGSASLTISTISSMLGRPSCRRPR